MGYNNSTHLPPTFPSNGHAAQPVPRSFKGGGWDNPLPEGAKDPITKSLSAVAPPARRWNQIFYPPSLKLRRISVSLESLNQEKLQLSGEGKANELRGGVPVTIVDLQAVSIKVAN
jgi:hypothetical protein